MVKVTSTGTEDLYVSREKGKFKAYPKNFHSRHKALTGTLYLPFRTVLPRQKHNLEPQTKAKFISGKLCPPEGNNCHNNPENFNIKCDQGSLEFLNQKLGM